MTEPTDEQNAAALRFCKDHSSFGNGWLVDEFTVGDLLAEREAPLHTEIAELKAKLAKITDKHPPCATCGCCDPHPRIQELLDVIATLRKAPDPEADITALERFVNTARDRWVIGNENEGDE